jgi:hypothetical protein
MGGQNLVSSPFCDFERTFINEHIKFGSNRILL